MSELKNAFANAFPGAVATEEGRRRVAGMAQSADQKAISGRRTRYKARLGLGLATAACAAVAGVLLLPGAAAAAYLHHVRQHVVDAKSAHIVEWAIEPDGQRRKTRELWYQNGKWRVDSPMFSNVTIADSDTRWVYSPADHSVSVSRQQKPYMASNGFTLTSMISDGGPHDKLEITDEGPFKKVVIRNPIDSSMITFWVDKATDYPVRGQIQGNTPHGLQLESTFECQFNMPLAEVLFTPDYPKETRVIDLSLGKAFWVKELKKVVGTLTAPGSGSSFQIHPVVIRNVQVAATGDVFVIYTGELDPRNTNLTDDKGNQYAHCEGFQAESYVLDRDTQERRTTGIVVDGQDINGGWWTPVNVEPTPWRARTLKFRAESIYYKADPEKVKKLPPGALVSEKDMSPVRVAYGDWSISVASPSCGWAPDYMPYMGIGPQNELQARQDDAEARSQYFIERGRFAEAEPWGREEVRLIQQLERTSGFRWAQSPQFFRMYTILAGLGRHEEARKWLERILDEPGGGGQDPQIRAALAKEGLG